MDKRNGFVFPVGMPIVEEYLPEGAGKSMDFVYKSAKQRLSPRDVEFIAEYSGLPVYVKDHNAVRTLNVRLLQELLVSG